MTRAKGRAQRKTLTINSQHMFANYEYSLTDNQQAAIQTFLRFTIPEENKKHPAWELLHELTYARIREGLTGAWTKEPKYEIVSVEGDPSEKANGLVVFKTKDELLDFYRTKPDLVPLSILLQAFEQHPELERAPILTLRAQLLGA